VAPDEAFLKWHGKPPCWEALFVPAPSCLAAIKVG
jgi:hypothetical protein